ncbi:MAG: hypothetical protein ACI9FG_001233 [Crocinitomicaceae bacterium]|jgi:hypothetical protein
MKTIIKMIIAVIMTGSCTAEDAVHRVKILKITSDIQKTPSFTVSGVKNKSTKPRNWLEIEAEVEVETTSKSKFIPEITANWYVVVKDSTNDKAVRLLGSVTFKNIRTKDKKIFLSAYIEPDTLERLTGKERPSDSDIEAVALTIEGSGIFTQGKYALGLEKATAKEESRWWDEWKQESLRDLIVAKSTTPFAPLWSDRYPTEKVKK